MGRITRETTEMELHPYNMNREEGFSLRVMESTIANTEGTKEDNFFTAQD
jgi:hypothetical protein